MWWWLGEAWDHVTPAEFDEIEELLSLRVIEGGDLDYGDTAEFSPQGDEVFQSADSDCGGSLVRVLRSGFNCRAVITEGEDIGGRVSPAHFDVGYNADEGAPRPATVETVIDATIEALNHYAEIGFSTPTRFAILLSPLMARGGVALPSTLGQGGRVWLGVDPTRGLVHHELFHQVQYEYIGWRRIPGPGTLWWMEATAEWAAHQLDRLQDVPTVRYADRLDLFLATPHERLDSTSHLPGFGREYGAFILPEYLDRSSGGPNAVLRTWQEMAGLLGAAPIDAIHAQLFEPRSLTNFWVWSYILTRDEARRIGFDDPDVPAWRSVLQTNPLTSSQTAATARPARTAVPLLPEGSVSGDVTVAPGGAAFIELNLLGTGSHRLEISVTSRSNASSDLRVAAVPMSDYPEVCGPVTVGEATEGRVELIVETGPTCSTVALALVNESKPAMWGNGSVKADWAVESSNIPGSDVVFVAGQGYAGLGQVEYVVDLLGDAGYQVSTAPTIPDDLAGIGQLWWIDWQPFPASAVPRLVDFVSTCGGLYLTGERPCCEALNERVSQVVNQLVVDGPVHVGGLGDPFFARGAVPTNPDATDDVTSTPFTVTEIVVDAPGGMAGISGSNVLASTSDGIPIAGLWNNVHLNRAGRLTVLMDVNWLDEARRGPQAPDLVQNLALFLSGLRTPPGEPVPSPMQESSGWSEPQAERVGGAHSSPASAGEE